MIVSELTVLFFMSFTAEPVIKTEKIEPVKQLTYMKKADPYLCAKFADAVEVAHCGYSGCDPDWWRYAYKTCMNTK